MYPQGSYAIPAHRWPQFALPPERPSALMLPEQKGIPCSKSFPRRKLTRFSKPASPSLPSAGRISFVRQAEQRRYCLHLLYAQPAHRGSVDVIEDIPPIYDTHIQLRVPEKIQRAQIFPAGDILPFHQDGEHVELKLPFFQMHTVIVFTYGGN